MEDLGNKMEEYFRSQGAINDYRRKLLIEIERFGEIQKEGPNSEFGQIIF